MRTARDSRVRDLLPGSAVENKIVFLLDGNMACDDLIVRVGKDNHQDASEQPPSISPGQQERARLHRAQGKRS